MWKCLAGFGNRVKAVEDNCRKLDFDPDICEMFKHLKRSVIVCAMKTSGLMAVAGLKDLSNMCL